MVNMIPLYIMQMVSGDQQNDIIVILNNDKAGLGNPIKDIHILNQLHDLVFKEATIEQVRTSLDRLAKIEQQGRVVTIRADKKKHTMDVSKYPYVNPRRPYFNVESIEYSIDHGNLTGIVGAYVVRDDWVLGGILGHLRIQYIWDGKKYLAKTVTFKQAGPS
ncbi:hypothetical protein [Neobacillus sp. Marseille-QA0830]